MIDHVLWTAALIFYGTANLFFWISLSSRKYSFARLSSWLLTLGAGIHLFALIARGIQTQGFPILDAYDALGLLAILIVAVYLIVQWKMPLGGLGFFAGILAFFFTLISLAFPQTAPISNPELSGVMLEIHIGVMILSFGILGLAFCSSLAYLLQDFLLHNKRATRLSRALPPLSSLDSATNALAGLGFVLLSIGIIFGSFWAQHQWGSWWSLDPKLTLALFTWLTYAAYIYARTLSGWKGRRSVFLILLGFALVLITFLGVNFIPSRHHFVGQIPVSTLQNHP